MSQNLRVIVFVVFGTIMSNLDLFGCLDNVALHKTRNYYQSQKLYWIGDDELGDGMFTTCNDNKLNNNEFGGNLVNRRRKRSTLMSDSEVTNEVNINKFDGNTVTYIKVR
jgi:hypothetical protein